MKYRLTVEQFEPNPNYASELKEWEDRRRYDYNMGSGPLAERQVRVLTLELTSEEFAAIKKATLGVM